MKRREVRWKRRVTGAGPPVYGWCAGATDSGRPKREARREYVTGSELMGELRLQGVEDLADVRDAYIEQDRRISVIRRDGEESGGNEKERAA
jgi:hypothetical protein